MQTFTRRGAAIDRPPHTGTASHVPAAESDLKPNTYDYETEPLVTANGFREYDARWLFGKEINLLGVQALGLGLGTYLHEIGVTAEGRHRPRLPLLFALDQTGADARPDARRLRSRRHRPRHDAGGLFRAVRARLPAVAMVTASHNENGWTGVKMGAQRPLTFGPDEMIRLKAIVLGGEGKARAGRQLHAVSTNFRERYLEAVTKGHKLSRPIKVIAACGNGTAGHSRRKRCAASAPK